MQRRNDLARAIDIVVVAVDLDQTCISPDTINIVVERPIFVHDAVLLRFRIRIRCGLRCVQHLTVCAEVIEASGKQIVRAIDPIMQRRNDLAGAIDIVVVAVDLDQARVGLDAVDVVVQLAILVYNAILLFGIRFGIRFRIWIWRRLFDHLAIRAKVIEARRKKPVGTIHPVMQRGNDLKGAVDIVIIALDLDQARIGRNAIHIVVKHSVDLNNSVIVRIRLKLQMSVLIEVIECFRKTCVIRIGHPVAAVFNCCIIAGKIIVISVFCLIQAVANHTVDRIVGISVQLKQSCMLINTLTNAILAEIVPISWIVVVVDFLHIAKALIAIAVLCKVIKVSVDCKPLMICIGRTKIISRAIICFQPRAVDQLAVLKLIGQICEEALRLSIQALEADRVEVIIAFLAVFIRQIPPAGLGHAVDGVIARAVQLDQARDLALTGAGHFVELIEIFVSFVIQTGDLVDALQRLIVDEVVGHAVDRFPAGPRAVVQNEAVGEILIGFAVEMAAARMRGVFRLLIGVNAVLLLEGGLAGHVVECVCAQIDVVADRAGVRDRQRLIRVPCRAVPNAQLYAAEDADGVGRIGIDGLTLLDKVALDGKKVVFVQNRRGQREVIVRHRQAADVHSHVLVKLELYRHFGLFADALRQLEQQIPCRDAGNVAAGDHRQQRLQLLRDLDRHHVQTENVGNVHRLAGIDHMIAVDLAVAAGDVFRVRDLTRPCKRPVAARRVVKVEDRLIFAVHGDLDRRADGIVAGNHCGHRRVFQSGAFHAGKCKAVTHSFNRTCRAAAQLKRDVLRADRNGIFVIGGDQGKVYRLAVDGIDARLGEFQAVRLDHVERLAADHRLAGQELHLHASLFDAGKYAVLRDRADGLVRRLPSDIRRKLRRTAGHADAGGRKWKRRADRQVVIGRGDQRMIELRRDRRSGNDHQRGADGTLVAVGGAVYDRKRVAALLLGNEGGRAAAVQIDGGHAARVQHDLRQLFCAAACGERLLTAVEHHQDDLALRRDADAGAGMAAVIVVGRAVHNRLAVLDQIDAAADGLLDLILIGVVFTGAADHARAILQDRKEARRCTAVVFDTLHDQRAVGSAGRHVVEVRIHADHSIVMLHIIRRIGRIGMPLLGRRHLVGDTGHRPAERRIICVIVRVDVHIVAGDIDRGNVIDDLLIVLCQRVVDRLRHAGNDRRRIRREHGIVSIIRVGFRIGVRVRIDRVGTVRVAGQIEQIVRKGIAARLAERLIVGKVGQRIRAFQRTDQGIPGISAQNLAPDTVLGDHAAQTVGQEVGSTACICKPCGEVVLSERAEASAEIHLRGEIERIHIAIEVGIGKRMIDLIERAVGHAEVSCPDVGRKNVHIRLRGVHSVRNVHVLGAVHQVGDIAGPAAHVGAGLSGGFRHALHLRVVRHIHRTEHMAEVSRIAVGQRKVLDVLQRRRRGSVRCVPLGNIGRKGCVFLAADHLPCAGRVALNARADEVDDERIDVLARIFLRVGLGVALQELQARKERRVVRNRLRSRRLLLHRERFIKWLLRKLFLRPGPDILLAGCKRLFVVLLYVPARLLVRRIRGHGQQRRQQQYQDEYRRYASFRLSASHVLLSFLLFQMIDQII